MDLFPAVIMGGPPHAGKSVLTYSLTQALRRRNVGHYVLRACPDGEGDWAAEIPQDLVRQIRLKGPYTPELIGRMCQDIARRMLPLLVDAGGKPTPEQERSIFGQCTHIVVLAKDDASRREWLDRTQRLGLILLADLRSELGGPGLVTETAPVVRGVVTGLERGREARGPALDALLVALERLFDFTPARLRATHFHTLEHIHGTPEPVEFNPLGRTLGMSGPQVVWKPEYLLRALDHLPSGKSLALYDRGPNWLYAAVALRVGEAPLYQFDVRLGWIQPPELCFGTPAPDAPLQATVLDRGDHVRVEFSIPGKHMDFTEATGLCVPPVRPETGVVLSGQLPLWLWTALARTYRAAPWVAVYHPALAPEGDRALVVGTTSDMPIGMLIASAP